MIYYIIPLALVLNIAVIVYIRWAMKRKMQNFVQIYARLSGNY